MSYWIEDQGGFVADVASNNGLKELRESAGPNLRRFIEEGKADAELCEDVAAETKGTKHEWLGRILSEAHPPATLTDGVIEMEDEESS